MHGKVIGMKDEHIRNFVIDYLERHVTKQDLVIDATVGNGFDTVLLSKLALHVIGFDIQAIAIETTQRQLDIQGCHNVTLYHQSFENIKTLQGYKGVVFNLGYLPHGDKNITTHVKTTLSTVQWITQQLPPDGFILITAYPGHPEGEIEANALLEWAITLDSSFISLIYQIQNRAYAPFNIVIERQKTAKVKN